MAAIQSRYPNDGPDAEIDLLAQFQVLWRGKWWIVGLSILATVATTFYTLRFVAPMYPARSTIVLEVQEQQVISDIESVFSGAGTDTSAINTEIEIFRSRQLVGQLVDDLDLVNHPEFGTTDTAGIPGALRALIGAGSGRTPEGADLRNLVIDRVIDRLSITNVRQSFVFNVSIETRDPAESVRIVNRLAELYVENQIQRKLDESTRAIQFLSLRTTELEQNLETLEQTLAQRMEQSDVIDGSVLQARNLQLRDTRDRITETETRLAQIDGLTDALDNAADAPALIDAAEATGDSRFSAIVQRFRSGRLSEAATEIALREVRSELANDRRRIEAQLTSLQRSEQELAAQFNTQSDELIELQQLEREVDTARLLYQTFLTRLQEASVQRGLETADSRILSEAIPRPASSPRVGMVAVLAASLGALSGCMIVLLREWRFSGFRTTDELRDALHTPVLGSLPALSTRDRVGVLKNLREEPNSMFSEAVRNLRTSVLMSNPDQEPQVILLTSSVPAEGKTTLSISLSRYFRALEGKRVLLVEADIRRQTLKQYFSKDHHDSVQLIDVVLGRVALEDVDLMDHELGVEVLMGSGGEFNAADLFESRRFRELIETLRQHYDHIIIDSPPVLAVPDARVLSRYSDLTVFVVHWASTTRTQVRQGLEMLASVGHPADGVVLSQVDQKKMKGYGYGGQYGYDGSSTGYYAHG
ncbi:polysaccharide biosynthesis tyrosine autokinase [Rhodobacterales bacterium HKCCE4037]|nr:polysaccharide biosynthesis tyrosine autokinase [Rhodobacterales bacterium HKCCE4037]